MKIQRILFAFAFVTALGSVGSLAGDPGLEATAVAVVDNSVSISIHNADEDADTARITLSVELVDGTTQTLTSGNVTVAGGATVSISLSAAQRIVAIGDDPDPITPTP